MTINNDTTKGKNGDNKKLLLVDDERDFALTLKTVLGANGFKDSFNDPYFSLIIFNIVNAILESP